MKFINFTKITLLFAMATIAFTTWAQEKTSFQNDVKKFLTKFHANPKAVMDSIPQKKGNVSQRIEFDQKMKARTGICKTVNGTEVCIDDLKGRVSPSGNDLARDLVDNKYNLVSNLGDMDSQNLLSKRLSTQPWSDDYWPLSHGILGKRYAEKGIYGNWQEVKEKTFKTPVSHYIQNGLVDFLSPSEKYDLFIGDTNLTLTKKMWGEGEVYFNEYGSVESWMGICHGWAPAAFMLDRPVRPVTVKAANGITDITFFPSDIKGLGSLLWSKNPTETRFVGGRCNSKSDAVEKSENGRIMDSRCFDTNPATWHQVVVNQIGISDRSFVMDATYDYEVWNQPVVSYSYEYFNVMERETYTKWEDAKVEIKKYSNDKFSEFRSLATKYIVGVVMRVEYVSETSPYHQLLDDKSKDDTVEVTYIYDLEVDNKGNIVGGEWYQNAHPDFLWVPTPGAKAKNKIDKYITTNMIDIWSDISARKVLGMKASRYSTPLQSIVRGLIEKSREGLVKE